MSFAYEEGAEVEVDGKIEEGCTGGWFPARVLELGPGKDQVKVQYLHVSAGNGKLEEQILKKNHLRPKPPTKPYTDFSQVQVGMIVDHLVENLWWLAIVLWVKKDKKGEVKEVGCVYPRTAGEAPNVANAPHLLRPAVEWSVKSSEWRPVLSAYKKPAFQDELDAQAKKRNVQSAEVHEDPRIDSKALAKFNEVKNRKPGKAAAEAKAEKSSKAAAAEPSEGTEDKKRGGPSRRSQGEAKPEKEKEKESKRTPAARGSDASHEVMRKSRRVESASEGVHNGEAVMGDADVKDAKEEKPKRGPGRPRKNRESAAVPAGEEDIEVPPDAAPVKEEDIQAANDAVVDDNGLPLLDHRFSLRGDQPPYAVFHDARAYFIIMVLPAVEPGNCWTQVTESGLVEIAWSMWGQESHWAEMQTLKLRQKDMLVNYIDDLLQPDETVNIPIIGQGPPDEQAHLFAHSTSIQLPVHKYGGVHTTGATSPSGAGRTPRASLRLGMYKIKIYKRPPDEGETPGEAAPAATSHSDRMPNR